MHMKANQSLLPQRNRLHGALSLALFAGLALSANAAITGQWDFKGSLAATIGQDLIPLDTSTQSGTRFGSTTSFGIAPIGGVPTNVMGFPAATESYSGYEALVGALGNNGGIFVNQYSIIIDVLFPASSSGKLRALFTSDNGNEFYVDSNNAIGYTGGSSAGVLTPDTWHRVAITVDTLGTTTVFIDGTQVSDQSTQGGLDGKFSISSYLTLFNDLNTNSQSGYIASLQFQDLKQPAGFIAALGGPVATGILTGPPPNPYIASETPTSNFQLPAGRSTIPANPLIQVVIQDGVATVNTNTIQLKLDGQIVPASISYLAPVTTISYQTPSFLPPLSSNSVTLSFQDSTSTSLGAHYGFYVGPYVALPASAVAPIGSANTPGFIYRVAQAPADATLNNNLVRAVQQLDGTLLDTTGVPFGNEADLTMPGIQPDGSYFVDQYEGNNGTIAFNVTGGAFYHLPGIQTYGFPGIPGTNGSTLNFADDTLTYLQLQAGTYTFGVNVGIGRVDAPPGADDGYVLFCGANPRDAFATVVGQFVRTGSNFNDSQNTNEFNFVAPVAGIYPFRLIHWQNNQGSDLGWYYVDPSTGNRTMINDPASSIPAYRVSNVPREPYVAEVYPAPGGSGFAANTPIQVVLNDDDRQVGSGTIKLYLNGTQVTPNSISKSGKITTVTYNPNASRTTVTNNVQVVYSDNASPLNTFTNNWLFTIVLAGASTPAVTGQWDFKGNISATVGQDLQYFDGPSGQTTATVKWGTCSSFGIPLINGTDTQVMYLPGFADGTAIEASYGLVMNPMISPNGGGTKVNQYTIIYDMYYQGGTIPFFNCQNTNMPHGTDGSLFLQNGTMGQGSGGYTMNHGNIGTGWHRIAFAADLSQNLITKWVDGVKAQDWVSSANGLDAARRAWQPTVILFGDNDGPNNSGDDHNGSIYLSSIQVRNGKMSDAEMVLLGGPSASKIPQVVPTSPVTGQWDFTFGDITARVGRDLQYFDGAAGQTVGAVKFGTCGSFGIPTINGADGPIMYVPGYPDGTPILAQYGFIMTPLIAPNGGGQLVNQYTIIYDLYYQGGVIPFFQCQNTNMPHGIDGSLFLQNGTMGQGSGGYTMNNGNVTTGWHRLAFAVDLSQNLITKWVDGVKAQDWVSSANSLDAARRAWQPNVILFGDNDGPSNSGDDHSGSIYVKSIQVSVGKRSDGWMQALGGPSATGIPLAVTIPTIPLNITRNGNSVTISWSSSATGWTLQSSPSLSSPNWQSVTGVVNNSVTLTIGPGNLYFRLIQ